MKRSGFVLLMTLALVLISAVVLSLVARRSYVSALSTNHEVLELQSRWAHISMRDVLLKKTSKVMEKFQQKILEDSVGNYDGDNILPSEFSMKCSLAGRQYELIFADMQAGVNVNIFPDNMKGSEIERAISELLKSSGFEDVSDSVNIRPQLKQVGDKQSKVKISSLGQVVSQLSADSLRSARNGKMISSQLVCWGNQSLNIKCASDDAIKCVLTAAASRSAAKAFIEARRNCESVNLSSLLNSMVLSNKTQREKIAGCLTDRSSTFAIWIKYRSLQRNEYYLAVGLFSPEKKDDDQLSADEYVCKLGSEFRW